MCCSIDGLLRTLSSLSICAASEMVDIGVLNSCVMLLMKSFFISVRRFCLKAMVIVTMKITSRMNESTNEGIINRIDDIMMFFLVGKVTLR